MTFNWDYDRFIHTHETTIGDFKCVSTEENLWEVEFQGEPIARGTAKDWKLARALMEAVVKTCVTTTYGI